MKIIITPETDTEKEQMKAKHGEETFTFEHVKQFVVTGVKVNADASPNDFTYPYGFYETLIARLAGAKHQLEKDDMLIAMKTMSGVLSKDQKKDA